MKFVLNGQIKQLSRISHRGRDDQVRARPSGEKYGILPLRALRLCESEYQ